jgi:hypothetical protein
MKSQKTCDTGIIDVFEMQFCKFEVFFLLLKIIEYYPTEIYLQFVVNSKYSNM